MSYHTGDTIAAVATASGGAARGMIRVSGADAIDVVAGCFTPDGRPPLDGLRRPVAVSGRMRIELAPTGEAEKNVRPATWVPCDLFVWPTGRSYTRQPVAELHSLGSPPVLEAALAAVCAAGARLAEPGEFTLRAFLAGRIDLTQAEAVLGVIDARGQEELDASLVQLAGGVARPLRTLRDELIGLLAELEAGLDFVDEDIEFVSRPVLAERLQSAMRHLEEVARQMGSRSLSVGAEQIALVGPPNAGKSSLFNALVARHGNRIPSAGPPLHAALVSSRRGTTRDYLTATMLLDGIRCELVDTAGVDVWPTTPLTAASQKLSTERRARAVIRAWCSDGEDESGAPDDCELIVLTKADIVPREIRSARGVGEKRPAVVTSSHTGEGLDTLCGALRGLLVRESSTRTGPVVMATAHRCGESVRLAESALRRASELAEAGDGDELIAAEVRNALAELGKVVGAVYTDDLLDRIFSKFCIGK